MQWSIRNLLNPVIARCLIYEVNPFDLESILRKVEEKLLVNAKMLENTWVSEWEGKAAHFKELAENQRKKGNMQSVSEYYKLAAKCYYASYLLNSDEIENKRKVYEQLAFSYKEFIMNSDNREEEVLIPFGENTYLPGYLHLPDEEKYKAPYPCVIIFTGMGSCKEEVEIKARPLVNRGIAVLAVDMPGTGEALFQYDIKLSGDNVELAIEQIMAYLFKHPLVNPDKLGTYGLCMGGGYAYRAAAKYPEIKCCVNLFPLFVSMLEDNAIPRWMRQGKWAEFQMENGLQDKWMKDMGKLAEGNIGCRYLLVHSEYDNWMELDKTRKIFDKTTGEKEEVIVHEQPVYATKESVMHAMPVGEQMHWIKIMAADFFVESFQ